MKNSEISRRLGELAREERRITNEILELLVLAMEQRAWLEFGFSSLFDWLTRNFGYSAAAAMRRIEAAKLLRVVPEAKEKLATGELSLTAMSKVQSAVRAEEKTSEVSLERRAQALKAVENLSSFETEKKLVELFPASGEKAKREVKRVVDDNTIRHSLNLSAEASENLHRAKEVLSHKFPNASDAEIIAFALEFLLEKKDPLRKSTSAAEPTSALGRTRKLLQKHQGQCSYKDPRTGIRCSSRFQIQIDHIRPRALGGTNTTENLRPLCRQHNLYEAERIFGREKVRGR